MYRVSQSPDPRGIQWSRDRLDHHFPFRQLSQSKAPLASGSLKAAWWLLSGLKAKIFFVFQSFNRFYGIEKVAFDSKVSLTTS
jgi:hypothetical protein